MSEAVILVACVVLICAIYIIGKIILEGTRH